MTQTAQNESKTAVEILYNTFFNLENSKTVDEDIMNTITETEDNICVVMSRIKSQNENDRRLKLKLAEYYLFGGREPDACQSSALKLFESLVDVDK